MEKYLGRKVQLSETFHKQGTFESMYAAQAWLTERGYNYGSTCATMPVAITIRPYELPWKWKNFTKEDEKSIDGVMIGDMRDGPVTIHLFNVLQFTAE